MNVITDDLFPDDAVPARLPHFHLEGGSLWFLISRQPYAPLNAEEQAVWLAIDGTASVRDLRARSTGSFDRVIRHFADLRVCAVIPGGFPANRRRILVIEPHMDDAALSVGGTMWLRRNECEFTVLTVAGVSNFTSYFGLHREYYDTETVSALRRAESALFMRHVGGRHLTLKLLEAPLRYRRADWTLDWFRQHEPSYMCFVQRSAGPRAHEEWAASIAEAVASLDPEEVWMPLGLGVHPDHELTRNACLHIMVARPALLAQRGLRLFQDVPYAGQFPDHTNTVIGALRAAGARLEQDIVDIGAVMPDKLRLLAVFGSQFKLDPTRPHVEACAQRAGASRGVLGEMSYRVVTLPTEKVEPLSCYADRDVIYALVKKIRPWLRRNQSAACVRFLLPVASGKWAEDMALLLRVFPRARLEMRVSRASLAETEAVTSPRIIIRAVHPGRRSWCAEAARTLLARPNPRVLVPGRGKESYARVLSALSVGSDSIIAPTMHHFVLALRLASGNSAEGGRCAIAADGQTAATLEETAHK